MLELGRGGPALLENVPTRVLFCDILGLSPIFRHIYMFVSPFSPQDYIEQMM